jgi:hypothetical protein
LVEVEILFESPVFATDDKWYCGRFSTKSLIHNDKNVVQIHFLAGTGVAETDDK